MFAISSLRLPKLVLLSAIAICILWKGGKAVDATWLLILVTAVLYLPWTNKQRGQVPRGLWLAGGAFVGLTVCSYTTSLAKNYGFDEVLQTISLMLIASWVVRNMQGEEREKFLRSTVRTIALAALIAAAIGIVVYTLQPVSRFVGTFFDYRFHTDYWPNAWAEFALLSWPLLLLSVCTHHSDSWSSNQRRLRTLLASAVSGLFFACLLLSYSRGAVLAFGLQMILAVGLLFAHTLGRISFRQIIGVICVSAAVATMTFGGVNLIRSERFPVESWYSKATLQADEGTSSVSERSQFWNTAVWMTEEKPLLGWGPYSFRFVQPSRQTAVLATADHPHNVVLKIAAERGVVAAMLFVFLLAAVLLPSLWRNIREGWHEYRTKKFSDVHKVSARMHRMAIVIGILGVLAHNMIDYNLQFMGIALPIVVLLALLIETNSIQKNVASGQWGIRIERGLAALLLIVGTIEGGWLVTSSLGRHAEKSVESSKALYWYEKSDAQLFTRDMLLSQAQLYATSTRYAEAKETLATYAHLNPLDYRAEKLMGDITAAQGNSREAIAHYDRANDSARFNDISVTQALVRELLRLRERSVLDARLPDIQRQMNDFAYAIERNTHFVSLSTNVESLLDLTQQLSIEYPEDRETYQALISHVEEQVARQRAEFTARPTGVLWNSIKEEE